MLKDSNKIKKIIKYQTRWINCLNKPYNNTNLDFWKCIQKNYLIKKISWILINKNNDNKLKSLKFFDKLIIILIK